MRKYNGKVACDGVAIGDVYELKKYDRSIGKFEIQNSDKEKERFLVAHTKALNTIENLYQKALSEIGESEASIFLAHRLMLEDKELLNSIIKIIEEDHTNAEYAIYMVNKKYKEQFEQIEDLYFKERISDITYISDLVIDNLTEEFTPIENPDRPCIVVADNLTPGETVQMEKSNVIAFVIRKGSVHSHTAILARTMAIPALVNVPVSEGINGKQAIVNTYDQSFILEPDDKHMLRADQLIEFEKKKSKLLKTYKEKRAITKSGKNVEVCANISGVDDVMAASDYGADGIGLFRTEFLYLDKNNLPSEEVQFETYKQVVELMGEKQVVIRIPDLGDDKKLDKLIGDKEQNPALGCRGMRVFFDREDLLRTHLRAALRAAAFGNVSIMLPMICSVWEVNKTKDIIEEISAELKASKIPYGKVLVGVMIETPAAVMMSEELAKVVDFFSIGTNDLTQYTLAADRQNAAIEHFYNPYHPAVLRMMEIAIKAAINNNIYVSVCGDLACDVNAVKMLVNFGVNQLSVAPKAILSIKKSVCDLS